VVVEPGVHGSLASGTYRYTAGERVRYRFAADSEYTNVLVMIDDDYAPNPGSVVMNHHHLLVVSADRRVVVPHQDAQLARALRTLLRHPSATAAQQYLSTLDHVSDTVNIDARLQHVAQAVVDPIRDASALKKLDRTLEGHILFAGSGIGSFTPPEPGGGGGGVIVMDKLAPLTPRLSVSTRALTGNEPVILAYVNGILTDPVYALNTAHQVAHLAETMQWPVDVPYEVRLLYNHSAIADKEPAHVTVSQCLWKLAKLVGTLGINSFPKFLATCSGKKVRDVIHHVDDFVEATRQYIQLTTNIGIPEQDAIAFADSTIQWREKLQQHVLFIAHSQGNLMVQQAVSLLAHTGHYHPAQDYTCIGAVSLAAPLSTDWPISGLHLRGVAVDGDAILALGTNHFPRVHTALSDSADAEVAYWKQRGSKLKEITAKVLWAIRLHDVVNSYLNQPVSRAAIEQDISFTYGSCALGKVLAKPRYFTMFLHQAHTFTATLFDINGNLLDGKRPLQWFITGTSVAEMPVILSATGSVYADTFGTEGIGVSAGAREDYVGVTVIPR
jgi:hypothetical protein